MLLLLFQVGDNIYALDTAQIVEVIPIVTLRKIAHVPNYVAGVFNYRGKIVPVVDVCQLIQGTVCRPRFSTRIILVQHTARDTAKNGNLPQMGLMAERVTETLSRPDLKSKTVEQVNDVPYLGEIFMDEKGMIQRIYWENLVSDPQTARLLNGGSVQNGASDH